MKNENAGEQLERLLLNCQQMAMCTLRGPGSLWNEKSIGTGASRPLGPLDRLPLSPAYLQSSLNLRRKVQDLPFDFQFKLPLPVPALPPIFFQPDLGSETSEVAFCDLEGKKVACFNIGGEDRLCLPPILNDLLKGIDLNQTNQACERLQIYFSRCTPFQLEQLKRQNILPTHIFSAGLIRKTDAERLCNLLLHKQDSPIIDPDDRKYPQINDCCFPVYHECFGEGHGFFYTELYTHVQAKCISCADCEKLFSPERFVTHSHYNQENGVCHWGFDRTNWRSYLLLSEDEIDDSMLPCVRRSYENALDRHKDSHRRRKALPGDTDDKTDVVLSISSSMPSSQAAVPVKRRCLRPPMRASGYDEQGQPILVDPDRVVSLADSHLYEKHFVPNITLKPKDEDKENCDDSAALDLSSPTHKTEVSNVAKETSTVDADEEIDVTSTDGTDDTLPEPVQAKQQPVPANKCDEITLSLNAMQELFREVLEKSSLSSNEKEIKQSSFSKIYQEVKGLL